MFLHMFNIQFTCLTVLTCTLKMKIAKTNETSQTTTNIANKLKKRQRNDKSQTRK